MKTQFPYDLSRLKINAQDPVEYERIQNDILRQAISRSTAIAEISEKRLAALTEMVERRTQIFSPTKGYSHQNYQRSLSMTQGPTASSCSYLFQLGLLGLLDLILFVCAAGTNYSLPLQILSAPTRPPENIGVYVSEDDGQLRAYINDLPSSTPQTPTIEHSPAANDDSPNPRERSQVDLVLPDAAAFSKPGQ